MYTSVAILVVFHTSTKYLYKGWGHFESLFSIMSANLNLVNLHF